MRPVADWDESDLDELHRGELMESLSLKYKDSPGVRRFRGQGFRLTTTRCALARPA